MSTDESNSGPAESADDAEDANEVEGLAMGFELGLPAPGIALPAVQTADKKGGSKGGKTPPVEHYLEVTMEQTFIS